MTGAKVEQIHINQYRWTFKVLDARDEHIGARLVDRITDGLPEMIGCECSDGEQAYGAAPGITGPHPLCPGCGGTGYVEPDGKAT